MPPRTTCWQRNWTTWAPKQQRCSLPEVEASASTKCSVKSSNHFCRSCNGFRRAEDSACDGSPCTGSIVVEFRLVHLPSWNRKLRSRDQDRLWARGYRYCRVFSFHFLKIRISTFDPLVGIAMTFAKFAGIQDQLSIFEELPCHEQLNISDVNCCFLVGFD